MLKKLFGKDKNAQPKSPSSPPPPPAPEPEPELLEIIEVTSDELQTNLEAGDEVFVVDLRQPWEYQGGHIPGSVNIPMMYLPTKLNEIPKESKVIMQCYHGFSSLDAAGYLIENGWAEDQVVSLSGGITGWITTQGLESLVRD